VTDPVVILGVILLIVGAGYGLFRKGTAKEKSTNHGKGAWVFLGLPILGLFISGAFGNNTFTTLIGVYLMVALFVFVLFSAGNSVGAAFNRSEGNSEAPRQKLCGALSFICFVFGAGTVVEAPFIGAPLLILCALLFMCANKTKPNTTKEK
jgi:Ca2+/Na+ antiporter